MIKLGRHAVYDEYHKIPRKKRDLVVTDPPWNKTNIKFDKEGFDNDHLSEWLTWNMKTNAWCLAFLPFKEAVKFAGNMRMKFDYVWKKDQGGVFRASTKRPMMIHETIYAFIHPDLKKMGDLYMDKEALRTKGVPYTRRSTTRDDLTEYQKGIGLDAVKPEIKDRDYREGVSVLEYNHTYRNKKEHVGHPTQKPLPLVRLLVRAFCPPGGTVLDPTLGSGTTLMACELEGRTCIGAETNPKYRKMITDRYNATLGGWQE